MIVVGFLGPDKRHIKASSDIHLIFFIALSDFFQEKRCSLTPSTQNKTTTTVQLPRSLSKTFKMS